MPDVPLVVFDSAKLLVLQERDSILRGPGEMRVDLSERLRHRESPEYTIPLGFKRWRLVTQGDAQRALPWALSYNPVGGCCSFVAVRSSCIELPRTATACASRAPLQSAVDGQRSYRNCADLGQSIRLWRSVQPVVVRRISAKLLACPVT